MHAILTSCNWAADYLHGDCVGPRGCSCQTPMCMPYGPRLGVASLEIIIFHIATKRLGSQGFGACLIGEHICDS